MKEVKWGIIGCGDVTEIKSGPAFNKVPGSSLVAVMRRDAAKAEDYAKRHGVGKWYADANRLIHDPEVNAIYIATPPSAHEEYTIAAIAAGKPVYVEKPMTMNRSSAIRMANMANEKKVKLVVAHYRRAQPLFSKIKELIQEKAIGEPLFARIELYKPLLSKEEFAVPKTAWRLDPAIAGGGLFHDLAPHQLDLMYYFFGEPEIINGVATNQAGQYAADDIVAGTIQFKKNVICSGIWCFNVDPSLEKDSCEIIGTRGSIRFSFFDHQPIFLTRNNNTETLSFDRLEHVQQPMISKVVDYFLDKDDNPCSAEEGAVVMGMLDGVGGILNVEF